MAESSHNTKNISASALPLCSSDYWAKTDNQGLPTVSVRDHSRVVAAVARILLERDSQVDKNDIPFLVWLCGLHDIGKISPGFQGKCLAWLQQHGLGQMPNTRYWQVAEKNHANISQSALQNFLKANFPQNTADAKSWAMIVGMHHGEVFDMRQLGGLDAHLPEWAKVRTNFAEQFFQEIGVTAMPSLQLAEAKMWRIAGLLTVSDWIGSDETLFPPDNLKNASDDDLKQLAETAIESIGLRQDTSIPDKKFCELFENYQPNALQSSALDSIKEPGVYVIEAPMGMGKTEAALAVAHKMLKEGKADGIYFALPTRTTSNRIHERVEKLM